MAEENKESGQADPERKSVRQQPLRLHVAKLLEGRRMAILEHGGEDYTLRITTKGKLILTK